MAYDYKSARERRKELVTIYRILKRHLIDDGTWSWWLFGQIEEIDNEIAGAHCLDKQKMTTARNSGHPILHMENIITPIIPAWEPVNKGESINA
ncbi:hypothetical protein [Paenibacillus radicis (ex Xue et al. 2023)]|uniref:Uncharacterized protein n=1 Tax=Paenibacillus radicis (ex Xue et al. 2023) TaxID=2972489 RepID=A0ABT1YRY0_9BACL|nr:hypothetical protein [Paenibacillus radicis (ex Xue et al. 2023)]MCR8635772.1 hypothetical protein [Paenibacillus radicis (ex Xue et al. 2023)]